MTIIAHHAAVHDGSSNGPVPALRHFLPQPIRLRMDIRMLMSQIERPEVQRALLAGYQGPFSIGIGASPNPKDDADPVVIVRMDDTSRVRAPHHIEVAGESVRVIVQGNYASPRKLTQLLS